MPIEIIESSKESLVKINSNDFLMNSLIPINKEIPNNSYVEFRLTSKQRIIAKTFIKTATRKLNELTVKI